MCLVDSYDTLNSGVPNFLCVACALIDAGYKPLGIRLDSGDLAYFSRLETCFGTLCEIPFNKNRKAKEMYRRAEKETKHDLSTVLVFASDDINEKKLKSLQNDVKQKFIDFLD
jgi:nicotinate phosphoribosyltransferase